MSSCQELSRDFLISFFGDIHHAGKDNPEISHEVGFASIFQQMMETKPMSLDREFVQAFQKGQLTQFQKEPKATVDHLYKNGLRNRVFESNIPHSQLESLDKKIEDGLQKYLKHCPPTS